MNIRIMYGAQAAKISVMLGIDMDSAQRVIDAFWDTNIGLKGRKEWLEKFWQATGKRYIPSFDGRKVHTRSQHSLLNAYQQSGGAILMDLAGLLLHRELILRGWYDDGVRRTIYYHDEYQFQVPNKYRDFYYFDTIEEADAFKEECEKKGKVLDSHEYKKPVKDDAGNVLKDEQGKVLYKPVVNDDGKIVLMYCPVGEMVVRSIERAAKMMGAPIFITGGYLTGQNWAECH